MEKILVTTDGSVNAKGALIKAKTLGEALGAQVDILHVVKEIIINPYVPAKYYMLPTESELKKLGKKIMENSLELFQDFKGQVNSVCEIGDPAEVIIEQADKGDYDLIIMGSRGLSTFSRAMLGSVSQKVLNHVKTSVLIVK